jgi:immune inhibitor A
VEWRNFDGFDNGLKYAYDTSFFNDTTGAWHTTFTPYNAPGMLVWYRDIQYGSVNHVTVPLTAPPSTGSKGALLIVDSHFDPMRRDFADGTNLRNMPSRAQSSNAAFTTFGTCPFTECFQPDPTSNANQCTSIGALAALTGFDDRNGYYPGIEVRGATPFFRDIDASVVLPSKDNATYTTRVVDQNGNPLPQLYGVDLLGSGSVLGTGRPDQGTDPENPTDLSLGVKFDIKNVGQGDKSATITVTPGPKK